MSINKKQLWRFDRFFHRYCAKKAIQFLYRSSCVIYFQTLKALTNINLNVNEWLLVDDTHHISISPFVIHQIFLVMRDWSKRVAWPNVPQLKLMNIRVIFPTFQNRARREKYLNDNKHNSLRLARKYARIFVLGHYLFFKLRVFLELLSRRTVRFSKQIMSAD